MNWDIARNSGLSGTGNWRAQLPPVERLLAIARGWANQLERIEKPWLCWCVNDEWCLLQQRLVASVGWTPVVGTDGTIPSPSLIPEALSVDFNKELRFPTMWMHFPLEFVFQFADRLAFWHSDFLPDLPTMEDLARRFEELEDGRLASVKLRVGLQGALSQILREGRRCRKWYEIVGCTTRGASASQFRHGCGWWRHIEMHPNFRRRRFGPVPHWEHGVGIDYWVRHFDGQAADLDLGYDRFHFAALHNKAYVKAESKSLELERSFDLSQIAASLGIGHLVESGGG